ncbi:hypothetical protein SAMN04488038_11377 [Solimonas aquatica]|uniref:Uncharacterized protein n=1 Tax=Solimonas aquatica TaxID=489703 RepID=A0A1H9KEX5_9GAMM|nr:hypothetical protein [Solimonas aquatica]SEQ97638.1 hypothetical protein SAMN04488038_11377 [Solimonas aquatica]
MKNANSHPPAANAANLSKGAAPRPASAQNGSAPPSTTPRIQGNPKDTAQETHHQVTAKKAVDQPSPGTAARPGTLGLAAGGKSDKSAKPQEKRS